MIHNITVINHLGEKLSMNLDKPEETGFIISNITGIGSVKAEIRNSEIVTGHGSLFNSARVPTRNIVIVFRFLDFLDKTIEQIRHESYKYFPITRPVTIRIQTDARSLEIEGIVEENEPVIFSRMSHSSISIVCPDPFFYEEGTNTTIFFGIEPLFSFPFSNESLEEPLLNMGEIRTRSEELIEYTGDFEVGIFIIMDAIGPVRNVTIHNVRTRETMFINTDRLQAMTGQGIIAGDRITINTVKGKKAITLLRGGVFTNIINTLTRGSDWFHLTKGDNVFAFEAEEGSSNLMFHVENRIIYEGV